MTSAQPAPAVLRSACAATRAHADTGVGLGLQSRLGEHVSPGQPLPTVHAAGAQRLATMGNDLPSAPMIAIGDDRPALFAPQHPLHTSDRGVN